MCLPGSIAKWLRVRRELAANKVSRSISPREGLNEKITNQTHVSRTLQSSPYVE